MKRADDMMAWITPVASSNLVTQVAVLMQKVENVMDWIWSQANTTVKNDGDKRARTKEELSSLTNKISSLKCTVMMMMLQNQWWRQRFRPFQVEVWIDFPSYDCFINAEMLNVRLDQPDTYI